MLWGLPPTFCGLVQRVGRAGRNLDKDAEAVIIVPKSILKDGVIDTPIVEDAVDNESVVVDVVPESGETTEPVLDVDAEGIRVQEDANKDDEQAHTESASTKPKRRLKVFNPDTNIHETRALLEFVQTSGCRWIPWDKFFKNKEKRESAEVMFPNISELTAEHQRFAYLWCNHNLQGSAKPTLL